MPEEPISPIEPTEASRVQAQQQAEGRKLALQQEMSEISMIQFANEAAFTPAQMRKRLKTLEEQRQKEIVKKQIERKEEKIVQTKKIEETAEKFYKKNYEMDRRALMMLHGSITGEETPEELLAKVMKSYPDHSLADEALEFLEQTTDGDLAKLVKKARGNLNADFGREVRAGRNMGANSRAFSEQGLGSPTGLRDLYREITGNPREVTTLFDELQEQFSFDKMKTTIDFLLHALGSDMKSKGPSISKGELHRLMSEARSLGAILWIYRFFLGRMDLIKGAYERAGMALSSRITFELLAKMFVQFLQERYPSMDKVLILAQKMGISTELLAQIILFGQMRDAVRGVAPKLFRSEQHRYDVLMSFIEALEELEDQMEEEEEEDEETEE